MKLPTTMVEKRALAGWIILAGLGVELVTVMWIHAMSFMVFASLGAALIGGGVLFYFYSFVTDPDRSEGTISAGD